MTTLTPTRLSIQTVDHPAGEQVDALLVNASGLALVQPEGWGTWSVTHVPTGRALTKHETVWRALAAAERLLDLTDWTVGPTALRARFGSTDGLRDAVRARVFPHVKGWI